MTRHALASVALLALLTASSSPARAFRPLCSNLGAGGGTFNDGCGACDADSAARWEPANVSFSFDRDVAPTSSGVSLARWSSDIDNALAAWNAIPGSTLTIGDAGDAPTRDWGGNVGAHEIFFSVNDNEWTNATGVAPNGGALGITEFNYDCDSDGDGRREPWRDGDIIMNGAPGGGFTWNCAGLDCPSSSTVLLHELGHALGLGHDCPECEDQLMSATLVVNVPVPLPDDALSLTSLYGDPGALGTPCAADGDCDGGDCASFAMPSGSVQYCSQACGACPAGFTCNASSQCELSSSSLAFLPDVGEPCSFTCVDDCFAFGGAGSLVPGCNGCLVDGSGSAACVKGCSRANGAGCDLANEFCGGVGTGDDQGACKPRRGEGGLCNDDSICQASLFCSAGVCRPACDPAGDDCAPGQECVDDGAGFRCRGGLAGEPCAQQSECATGTLCTGFDPFFCFTDCASAACPTGEVCADGGNIQICVVVRAVGESCAEYNVFCADDSDCLPGALGSPICSRPCSLADGSGCDPGELCSDVVGDGTGLCLVDGGAPEGAACTSSSDCIASTLCFDDVCTARCDLDVPCDIDELCEPVGAGSVCIPDPDVVVGEGEGEGEGDAGEGEGEGDGFVPVTPQPDPPQPPPEGCACSSTSPSSLLFGSLLLLFRRRRDAR